MKGLQLPMTLLSTYVAVIHLEKFTAMHQEVSNSTNHLILMIEAWKHFLSLKLLILS